MPVLFTLSSWDPGRQRLPDWMIARLVQDYTGLRAMITSATGRKESVAAALVDGGRILPVLDGLDQIGPGLRAEAIAAINRLGSEIPLVVTSREAEYRQAADESGRGLSRMAAIELMPLEPAEVDAYLAEGAVAADRWQRVRAELRGRPRGPLAQALRTPLMAWLMRVAYADPATDPGELCDLARFPGQAAIEDHLLGHLAAALYPAHPVAGRKTRRDDRNAGRYLAFLASQVKAAGTADIAWWQLERCTPSVHPGCRITTGILLGFAGGLPAGIIPALACGAALGIASSSNRFFALLRITDNSRLPLTFRFTPREYGRFALTMVILITGVLASSTAVFEIEVTRGYTARVMLVLIILGLAGIGLITWSALRYKRSRLQLFVPVDLARAVSPAATLRADRTTALAGPWPFLAISLLGVVLFHERPLLVLAVAFAAGWLLACPYTRFAIARLVLAWRGCLPWRTMRFLSDAHDRGLLRQIGAVYQFRHERLQEAFGGSGN